MSRSSEQKFGVLVVEDEAIAGRAHANYVSRLNDFYVVGIAKNASQALAVMLGQVPSIDPQAIDLVLLDMNLGDGHGIQLLRAFRTHRVNVDAIAVTASREFNVVHNAKSLGVFQYIVKPFTFPVFQAKLAAYVEYRRSLEDCPEKASQQEIDALMSTFSAEPKVRLAKKVPADIQHAVLATLKGGRALSGAEAGDLLGVSRVTARRYLEAMADAEILKRQPRYGSAGRPVLEYTLPDNSTE